MEPEKNPDTAGKGGEQPKEEPKPKIWDTIEKVGVESQKDPELRKEYEDMIAEKGAGEAEKEFLRLHLKKEEWEKFYGEDASAAQPEPHAAEPEPKKEGEVLKLEIPKQDLLDAGITGTDTKSVIDGLKQKHLYVESLTKETIPGIQKERDQLKAANDQLSTAAADLDKAMKDTPLPDEMKVDDLPEELFTPEDQAKLKNKLKGFSEAFNQVVKRQKAYEDAQKKAAAAKPATPAPAETPAPTADPEKVAKEAQQAERTAVDQLRAANPKLFKVGRPIEKIEDHYHNFMHKLGETTGVKVYDENGVWTEDIKKQFDVYADEEKGKDLKAKLNAAGIGLPDDFDDIILIHDLREIRRKNGEPDGVDAAGTVKFKPWSWEKALDFYVKSHAPDNPKMEEARAAQAAEAKAAADRKKGAPEFKPGGKQPLSAPEIQKDFQSKYAAYLENPTPDKRKWLEDAMKSFSMGASEIEAALTVKQKT